MSGPGGRPPGFDEDPEHEARERMAERALHRVALALLAEVRGRDSFPREPDAISTLLDRVRSRLPGFELSVGESEEGWRGEPDLPARPRVRVKPDRRGCVSISSQVDGSSWEEANIYADGELAEAGSAATLTFYDEPPPGHRGLGDELEADLAEIARRSRERGPAPVSGPVIEGDQFLRAVVARPQPGAKVQLRSVELYADGLIVSFLIPRDFDWENREVTLPFELYASAGMENRIDERIESALSEGRAPRPRISVEDDLGTDYRHVESGGGGAPPVMRGTDTFVPAVPADARLLRITTYAGTVQLPLT